MSGQAGDEVNLSGAENEAAAFDKERFLSIDLTCAWLGLPLKMCMLFSPQCKSTMHYSVVQLP